MLSEKQSLLKTDWSFNNRLKSTLPAQRYLKGSPPLWVSEDDPIIWMQPSQHHMRKFNGYTHVLRRYQKARALRQIDGLWCFGMRKKLWNLRLTLVDWGMCSSRNSNIISSLVCHENSVSPRLYVPVRAMTRMAAGYCYNATGCWELVNGCRGWLSQ